jgi:hypothetical protein
LELDREQVNALEYLLKAKISSLLSRAAPEDYIQAEKLRAALEYVEPTVYWMERGVYEI